MGLSYLYTVPIKNPWILQPHLKQFYAQCCVYLLRPVYQAPLYLLQSHLYAYHPCLFLIIERVSPTVHFIILSYIFYTSLAAFVALLQAIVCKIPIRGRLLQTLALLLKLVLNLIPATLRALNSSKRIQLDNGKLKAYLILSI